MSSLQKFHRRTQSVTGASGKLIGSDAPVAGAGFYLGKSGDGTSNMYVAPESTEVSLTWGSSGTTRNTISTTNGLANTNTLYAFGQTSHPAAYYCKTLATGGYNSWYMPAKNEMITIYSNQASTPFALFDSARWYIGSTEGSATLVWIQRFDGSYMGFGGLKSGPAYVRAVRRSTV